MASQAPGAGTQLGTGTVDVGRDKDCLPVYTVWDFELSLG